jgi:RNA ligase (TIGR02306 family)
MRKLASIRQISDIQPIEGADLIVRVKVDDWYCVALKSEFKVGDMCVYFEIDSFIPIIPQVEHLRARAYKKMGDKEGIRIKTIKLKGQISQGLVLPVHAFFDMFADSDFDEGQELSEYFFPGNDVSDLIGVEKYEQPVPAELNGQVKGNFPGFIKKTDQERCQNIGGIIFNEHKDTTYEITMKLDGTSFTGFQRDKEDGVCGRNWQLQMDEWNANNALVRLYVDSGLQSALNQLGRNIAVQGELMGPKIQANREGFASYTLFVFDIYNIDTQQQLSPDNRRDTLQALYDLGMNKNMVQHVPIFAYNVTLADMGITNVAGLLKDAEGESIVHPVREGKVYKSMDGQFSFKAISDQFLLKEKD